MKSRLQDEFCIEALKYQTDYLNFSFSNADDFWKVRNNQKIPSQKIILPVAFRKYDKSKNLINVLHPSSNENSSNILNDIKEIKHSIKFPKENKILKTSELSYHESFLNKNQDNSFNFANSGKSKIKKPEDNILNLYFSNANEEKIDNEVNEKKEENIGLLKEKTRFYTEVLKINSNEIEKQDDVHYVKAISNEIVMIIL